MDKKMIDLLYRSFEQALSEVEQRELDDALARSPELRQERELLQALFGAAGSERRVRFAPFFDSRVMARIAAAKGAAGAAGEVSFFDSLLYAFQRVAVIGALAALAIIIYNLGTGDTISLAQAFRLPELSLSEVFDPFFPLNP